ncbi:hypothetical protein GQX74_006752 [Glossina fuscipes]|nr:hypothetical protein GQX74_006752 [Glossina fuscipes]
MSLNSFRIFSFYTLGFVILNTTKAPDNTRDNRPKVMAFQVFKAIKARANGTKTVVFSFKPIRKGKSVDTQLIALRARKMKCSHLCWFGSNDNHLDFNLLRCYCMELHALSAIRTTNYFCKNTHSYPSNHPSGLFRIDITIRQNGTVELVIIERHQRLCKQERVN